MIRVWGLGFVSVVFSTGAPALLVEQIPYKTSQCHQTPPATEQHKITQKPILVVRASILQ